MWSKRKTSNRYTTTPPSPESSSQVLPPESGKLSRLCIVHRPEKKHEHLPSTTASARGSCERHDGVSFSAAGWLCFQGRSGDRSDSSRCSGGRRAKPTACVFSRERAV